MTFVADFMRKNCGKMSLVSQYFRYLGDMRLSARSSQVLQQQMEDIRMMSWTELQSLSGTFTDPNDTSGTYAGTIAQSVYDTYDGTETVTKVTLNVTWNSQSGRAMTNSLSSLVSNGGLNTYFY